jgi:adenosyl cobinamide kinase/adenosyl cobinamide phosphate guanylyltransferase
VVPSRKDPSGLILVLGGARSGKSTFAERFAAQQAAVRVDAPSRLTSSEPVPGAEPGAEPGAQADAAARLAAPILKLVDTAAAGPPSQTAAGPPPQTVAGPPPQTVAGRVTFLATSETNDPEMAARVAAHRAARPAAWTTVECPLEVAAAVRSSAAPVFLLDCVTFWVSNLLFAAGDLGGTVPEGLGNFDKAFIAPEVEDAVARRVTGALDDLLAALRETGSTLIAVSNEVGLGVVPEYPIARLYRDELGRANRRLAEAADEVYLLVAGIPLELKALAFDPFAEQENHE